MGIPYGASNCLYNFFLQSGCPYGAGYVITDVDA